ncbi:MAG TPA: KTSC domain-containing protein [Rhizomicrobium sp.]
MPALDSSALLAVHYDYGRKVLRATFRDSRRTYDYFNVSPKEYGIPGSEIQGRLVQRPHPRPSPLRGSEDLRPPEH